MNEFMTSVVPVIVALLSLILFVCAIRWYLTLKSNSSTLPSNKINRSQEEHFETNGVEQSKDEESLAGEKNYRDTISVPLTEDYIKDNVPEENSAASDHPFSEAEIDLYDAIYLTDCPLDKDGPRLRLNRDIEEKIRILTWFRPNLSVSSFVNNVLREHFREYKSVLEQKVKSVSISVNDDTI